MGAGGVGAVGAVGHDDLGFLVALVPVVGGDDHDAREFAVRAGHGLQGEGLHPADLAQQPLGLVEHLQRALAQPARALELRQHRVQPGEARQGGRRLGELGVVLHGAGAQRVEVTVHAVVLPREVGEVAHHVQLGERGQVGRAAAQKRAGQQVGRRLFGLGGPDALAPGNGAFEDGVHLRHPRSISANMPMDSMEVFSVQATSRAFSSPA